MLKQIIFFICFGITIEVVFTALRDFIFKKERDFSLMGYTYLWMIPVYAIIPVLFPILIKIVEDYHFLVRALIYGIVILIVEYTYGFFLKRLIKKCPWEYNSTFSIHGFIRLDYLPLWMFFGLILEFLLSD